jgi:plasmid stabilization system protein ParE
VGNFYLSREALDDLDLIWAHIAQDNPEAADQVLEAAYGICKIMANHIIFYRLISGDVQIVRILHGGRDIENILKRL